MLSSDRHRSGCSVSRQTHTQTSSTSQLGRQFCLEPGWPHPLGGCCCRADYTNEGEEAEWSLLKMPILGWEDKRKGALGEGWYKWPSKAKAEEGKLTFLVSSPAPLPSSSPESDAALSPRKLQNTPSEPKVISISSPIQTSSSHSKEMVGF